MSADTTVGQTSTPTGDCTIGMPFTLLQTASGEPGYTVPSNGVITSWRSSASTGTSTRGLKVVRTAAGVSTVVGAPASVTAAAGQPFAQNVRIPALAGDIIGFSTIGQTNCVGPGSQSDAISVVPGDPATGTVVTTNQGPQGIRIDIAAVLEPDADNDGFGDTTQDKCATDATTQGICRVTTPPVTAPVKDTVAPQTTVVSAKAAKVKIRATKPGKHKKFKKAKVTVVFASTETSNYTCAVDGDAFTACASPFTVKLKKGTHTIAVKATDAAGNVDATPATTTVEVKKASTKQK